MGPAFILAWVLFVCGCAWRAAQFTRLTRMAQRAPAAAARPAAPGPGTADREFLLGGQSWLARLFSRYRRWAARAGGRLRRMHVRVHIMAVEWEQKVREIVEGAGLLPRPSV
jgi:hypothetical protein